jgi:repressor LexA
MEYFFKEKSFPTSEILTIPCLPSISAAALSIADGIECDEIEFIKLPASFLGEYQNVENLIAFKKIGRDDLKDGDIAVYYFGNEYAVRRYRKIEQQKVIILSPESTNKNFHDCIVPFNTESDLKIIAKVIWYGVSV